ncbi:fibronectin type III domain-containing protein [Streptomyces sp. NPDC007205]|uniref:fibronectin type III domain-containing protein n=1 Tax=Streptomyces sp. NPDC007205 TaxID=3154316 RepID=UPI0033E588B0
MRLRKSTSRTATTASAVVLLAAASLTTASGAQADHEKTLTAAPLATWQTDGVVWSVEYARGVVYVGGTFDRVRPPGAKRGEKEVARKSFAAFDAVTGKLLPCAHSFTGGAGTVRALKASRDGKVLYVGGSFGRVDRTGVASAVALNTADCSLRKDFRPAVAATVRTIETTDKTVYLGGEFTVVNGLPRKRLAAFSRSGSLLPFSADIDEPVRAVLAVPDRGQVLVGGAFHNVNGRPEQALVSLDPTTGATVRSFPDWIPERSAVTSLARNGDHFYLGAEGSGTGIFDGRIAGRLSDGTMVWKDTCLGATQDLVVRNGILYSASHAHYCGLTPGGFPDGPRRHFLAQSAGDKRILHWFPDTDDGIGEGVGPRALALAGDILWAGGEFTTVNGTPQQGLTRFGTGPRDAAPQDAPRLTSDISRTGKVTLTWRAAWDRDDAELTYRIYRDGVLVATRKQRSAEWDRPEMTYTDSVSPGTHHRYTIAVTDGTNTTPRSAPLDVTAFAAK